MSLSERFKPAVNFSKNSVSLSQKKSTLRRLHNTARLPLRMGN